MWKNMKKKFQPNSITLQWHVTERCNWRCKHCYQENYETPEMNLGQMEEILVQFIALVKKWKLPKRRARINITGGEPFIRKDFLSFLEIVNKYSDNFRWTILSNGSLLTEDIAKRLRTLGILSFQLSLEGIEETNDKIRGKGSFQKVLNSIKLLTQANIPTRVSLTLSKQNFREIRELAQLLAPLNISRLAVRRIAPLGLEKNQFRNLVLEPQELRDLYSEIEGINKELKEKNCILRVMGGCENAIFNDEISSSPDLMSYGTCGVNEGSILTLLPDGDVLICRRLPIKIGNVLVKSLEEIYYSPLYENFRGKNEDVPLECYLCPNQKSCSGGAKCVTYAMTGKTTPDVQCWKLFDNLDESTAYIKRQNWFKKFLLLLKIFRFSKRNR
jgi:radical SAM protein with 4Fe4S-binding SPASM domain